MNARIRCIEPREHPSVEAVIAALADQREPAVLDSADTAPGRGRFTVIAFDPVDAAAWHEGDEDPFEGMRKRLADMQPFSSGPTGVVNPARFLGWIGYFAYEAGRYIERLPAATRADIGLPLARFARYDTTAVHDAATGRWMIVAAGDRQLAKWQTIMTDARPIAVNAPRPASVVHNLTRSQYFHKVARAREYIAAGDIFQVNFARRETFEMREPAWRTYLRLRRRNPAAYAAFLAWRETTDMAILSASPELFLRLDGREAVSRPIKGTRPRAQDSAVDAAYRAELAASEKDRAELAMIVDLVRNDLGRVCEYGSVRVVCPPDSPGYPYELETHPTVHHLVATVTGRLAEGRDAIDLIRASFPGGSITGAPKVRAMQIIDELEPVARSVYTGSIGMFGLDGSMTLNIAIRTLIAAGGRMYAYAGGGIVADSVPEDEYDETRAKVDGLHRALGISDHADRPVQIAD